MTTYPLILDQIVDWCRSKQRVLSGTGVVVAAIQKRSEPVPAVAADFTGADTMGRINGWVTGEFDFEVLRVSDGKDILFRHVKITTMHESILEKAYEDFLQGILRPDIR